MIGFDAADLRAWTRIAEPQVAVSVAKDGAWHFPDRPPRQHRSLYLLQKRSVPRVRDARGRRPIASPSENQKKYGEQQRQRNDDCQYLLAAHVCLGGDFTVFTSLLLSHLDTRKFAKCPIVPAPTHKAI